MRYTHPKMRMKTVLSSNRILRRKQARVGESNFRKASCFWINEPEFDALLMFILTFKLNELEFEFKFLWDPLAIDRPCLDGVHPLDAE